MQTQIQMEMAEDAERAFCPNQTKQVTLRVQENGH